MKWSIRSIVILAGVMLSAQSTSTATADTLTVSQQIKITAVVAPTRYVIVDVQNQVQQIISNNSDNSARLSVYQDSVQPENIRPLTSGITYQTEVLLKDKAIKPGVLYKRDLGSTALYGKKALPFLSVRM